MTYFAPNLNKNKNCFFGRQGGVSTGKYAGLNINVNSGDAPQNIRRNYEIICQKFSLTPQNLFRLNQGVSADAVFITEPSFQQITADGVVTDKENIILSLSTADCAPVLLCDEKAHIIGAAHAGWRGAYKGIIENTVKLMISKGAKAHNIKAAIGPCILQPSLEMGAEVYEMFMEQSQENQKYFAPSNNKDHYLLDLETYVYDKLIKQGLENISASHQDTYTRKEEYFSFRRETHEGTINRPKEFATELSTIVL